MARGRTVGSTPGAARSELTHGWKRVESPIQGLPVDILQRTLLIVVYDVWADGMWCTTATTQLALVCRFWKDVVYRSQLFWNHIDLTNPDKAEFYLSRAPDAALHFTWLSVGWDEDAEKGDDAPEYHSFPMPMLKLHSKRVRSLTINDKLSDLFRATLDFGAIDFPMLQEFSMTARGCHLSLMSSNAPYLRTLHFSQMHVEWDELIALFKHCPHLQRLEFDRFKTRPPTSVSTAFVWPLKLERILVTGIYMEQSELPIASRVLLDYAKLPEQTTVHVALHQSSASSLVKSVNAEAMKRVLLDCSRLEFREDSYVLSSPRRHHIPKLVIEVYGYVSLAERCLPSQELLHLLKSVKSLDEIDLRGGGRPWKLDLGHRGLPPFGTIMLGPDDVGRQALTQLAESYMGMHGLSRVVLDGIALETPLARNSTQLLIRFLRKQSNAEVPGGRLAELELRVGSGVLRYEESVLEKLRPLVGKLVVN